MSRANKKAKKGMNPIVAVGLFLVCGGIAGKSLLGLGQAPAATPADAAGGEVSMEELAGEEGAAEAGVQWRDLLVVHGSYDRQSNVQLAFRVAEEAAVAGAAPFVETAPGNGALWIGVDPPTLRLGVVMVSGATRRAVLGGRVVGVGDSIADARIAAIEPGQVTLEWNSRKLNYTLDSDVAVEFRGEVARREAAKQVETTASAGADAEIDDETADPAALAEQLVKAKQAAEKAAEAEPAAGKNDKKSKTQKSTKPQKKEAGK